MRIPLFVKTSSNIFSFTIPTTERVAVARASVSSFLIQIGFAGLSFITTTVLVRFLGSEGYGAYSNTFAWVNILTVIGLIGFNSLLLREIAILKAQNNWASIRGLLKFSDGLILLISIFLVLVLLGVAGFMFSAPGKENLRLPLLIAAPLIPLYMFINLRQSALRGMQQVTHAMLPDYIIRPGLILVCVLGVNLLYPGFINIQITLALSIAGSVVALWISVRWLRLYLPESFYKAQPQYEIRAWVKLAPPMFVIGSVQMLIAQLPVIMLGVMSSGKDVGYFTVASRVATLLIFLPLAVGIVMGPMIASLYSEGKKTYLQHILKLTNRFTFAITFLFSLLFIIFAQNILSIFGQEFNAAQRSLILLTIGYLVDSGFGLSIITLMMTGHERIVAGYQTFFAVFLAVLCILLIPSHGYESAALAFMIVMVISRFIFAFLTKRETGINTTIF
jgi:O-antigen/teichoic acid export membrane protein